MSYFVRQKLQFETCGPHAEVPVKPENQIN